MDTPVREGLAKKLQRLKSINWERLGKSPLSNQILDDSFIEHQVRAKQKAYNKMPITFNSSILKISIQERMIRLYSNYFQEIKQTLAPLESKVDKLINTTRDQLLRPHTSLTKGIDEEKSGFKVMQTSQQVSDQEIRNLRLKQSVLRAMTRQLLLSEEEKAVVVSSGRDEVREFSGTYYSLIAVLKKIGKIEVVIRLIQEHYPGQSIAESVEKEVKEMKVAAEAKLLGIFKETAASFENLNILNEIESYDVVGFTSQVFALLKDNEQYMTHCLARIRDAFRKAVYKDYQRVDSLVQSKPNPRVDFKTYEVFSLLRWLFNATTAVLDIYKAVLILH